MRTVRLYNYEITVCPWSGSPYKTQIAVDSIRVYLISTYGVNPFTFEQHKRAGLKTGLLGRDPRITHNGNLATISFRRLTKAEIANY